MNARDDVREAYASWAATYDTDRNLTRDLDGTVTRQVLSQLRPATILETGCGTGKNTPFLAEIGAQVVALDFSPEMLARARSKVQADNVFFAQADLTRPWPCANACMELVVCNLVLEHIEDLGLVFSEAARVLVDGGRFFVCELHAFWQYEGKQAVFQRDGEQVAVPAFVHHISSFLAAAEAAGLALVTLGEWWHAEDEGRPPRLVSFLFEEQLFRNKQVNR
ncbi:MAG: class I SAM-dependent methyltransferase [Chloroflexi bacterium]|nr:class I SAM-dependent methyltransferase [Chloroflexota bacterium]